jgi:hypothetical protein
MSKVPNWGFCGLYHLDFIGIRFRAGSPVLADENSREINSQISKTALLAVIARPGREHCGRFLHETYRRAYVYVSGRCFSSRRAVRA